MAYLVAATWGVPTVPTAFLSVREPNSQPVLEILWFALKPTLKYGCWLSGSRVSLYGDLEVRGSLLQCNCDYAITIGSFGETLQRGPFLPYFWLS